MTCRYEYTYGEVPNDHWQARPQDPNAEKPSTIPSLFQRNRLFPRAATYTPCSPDASARIKAHHAPVRYAPFIT